VQRKQPVTPELYRRAEPEKLSAGQRPFVWAGNRPNSDIRCPELVALKRPLGPGLGPPRANPSAVKFFQRLAVVCFDSHRNWRYELQGDYKGTRTERKPELSDQLSRMRDYIDDHGSNLWITWLVDGFEADDLCAHAALTKRAEDRVTVVSRDKDLRQLVDDAERVRCFDPVTRVFYDEAATHAKHGVYPHRLREWLAISGDASDNVKGAPQWGEDTTAKAIAETLDLEHLLEQARGLKLKSVTASKQRTLREWEPQIRKNYEIVGFRAP
jgi:5'-3' exonuclease